MINLIPPKVRKDIVLEYWVRVVTVWLFILSAFSVITAILLLPVYVLVTSQVNAYSSFALEASEKVAEYDLSATALVRANNQAQMVIELRTVKNFSEFVKLFESLRGDNISITKFEFIRDEIGLGPVQIAGRATSRQALIEFRDSLLSQTEIENVNLPISNLTKDKDIPFLITVKVVNGEE